MQPFKFMLLLACALLVHAGNLHGQQHYDMWLRGTAGTSLGRRLQADVEIQYRRQSGYGNSNLMAAPLMMSIRTWLHYMPDARLKLSLSPFAWFSNNPVIVKIADEDAAPAPEVRWSVAAETRNELRSRLFLVSRQATEYRYYLGRRAGVVRLRSRFGIRYLSAARWAITLTDELLINAAGVHPDHYFDHNRIWLDFEYKLSPALKLNAGYMHIHRLPSGSLAILQEHNALLSLSWLYPGRHLPVAK